MRLGTMIMLGGLSAFIAVGVGAFGAHGITDDRAKAWIETGSQQHMAHALAILVCAFVRTQGGQKAVVSAWLFLAGTVLFSGSLYALALGAPRSFAMAAPFGGLCFLTGWLILAWDGWMLRKRLGLEGKQS